MISMTIYRHASSIVGSYGDAEEWWRAVERRRSKSCDNVNHHHHHHHVLHVDHLGHILHVPRIGHLAQCYCFLYLSYITGLMQLEGRKVEGYKLSCLFETIPNRN